MLTPLEYLKANIRKYPEKLALSDTEIHLSYYQMQKVYKTIAVAIFDKRNLNNRQISVAILLNRNVYYICTMFASWELGGYFIPLNIEWPPARINEMIEQCNPDIVVCHKAGEYSGSNALYIEDIDFNVEVREIEIAKSLPSDIAYIIFTSGSTGKPKGVMISNQAYLTYIEWTIRFFKDYSTNKRLLITAELTFDITMGDIAFAIAFSTSIFVAPDSKNIVSLVRIINKYDIDTFYSVPTTHSSFFNFVMLKRDINVNSLKLIVSGGDVFSVELIKTIKKIVPFVHFYNVYGPTEVTINCFAVRVDNLISDLEKDGKIPIGLPFDVIDAVIIDEAGEDVTEKIQPGVLYVAGPQVMLGYYNDPAATQKAFVRDPRYPRINRMLYNTGDLAVKKSDGRFYLMGRIDNLVKIKGYRIHPNEVTTVLRKIEEVQEAATVAVESKRGKNLISFVSVFDPIEKEELFQKLREELPKYMLPEEIVIIDKMPLNNSGKIDKLKLISFYQGSDSNG